MKIIDIKGRQILDSRGNPTVEADVILENNILGRASVPSGASTGTNEAKELRDDAKAYNGKGVLKAVENINTIIKKALIGKDSQDQYQIDETMISLDGSQNKSTLGANAILAVSLANVKASSNAQNMPLFVYLQQLYKVQAQPLLPVPMMNIINGGKHAHGSTDIQEFMIMPVGAESFSHALQIGAEVFHELGNILTEKGYQTTVGDEGGYAPTVKEGNKEAVDLIELAIKRTGYTIGQDIILALDVAASELYSNGKYFLKTENKELSTDQMISWLSELTNSYPIKSIEDGLSESDWDGWIELTKQIGQSIQLVGDDLFVTNTKFLETGIEKNAANAILIKLNQIGTLTETVNAVKMAQDANWKAIISHRSGETEDTTIASLVVGLATGQIKTGSLSRTDRIAKYNELLRIEEILGNNAIYAGREALKR